MHSLNGLKIRNYQTYIPWINDVIVDSFVIACYFLERKMICIFLLPHVVCSNFTQFKTNSQFITKWWRMHCAKREQNTHGRRNATFDDKCMLLLTSTASALLPLC